MFLTFNVAFLYLQSGSKYGMAYDAIHLYAMAFRKLIDLNKTINGPTLASTIRKVGPLNSSRFFVFCVIVVGSNLSVFNDNNSIVIKLQ